MATNFRHLAVALAHDVERLISQPESAAGGDD